MRSRSIPGALAGQGQLRIVANLPYNVATVLVFHWFERLDCIERMVLMFQKEVALRLAALPGTADYGRLSVMAQRLCRVERLFDLPAAAFTPPPKVISSIVRLQPRPDQPSPELRRALGAGGAGSLRPAPQDAAPEPALARWRPTPPVGRRRHRGNEASGGARYRRILQACRTAPGPARLEPCELAPMAELDVVGGGKLGAARRETLIRHHQRPVTLMVGAGGHHLLHRVVADRPAEELALDHQPLAPPFRHDVRTLVARRAGERHPPAGLLQLFGAEQLELDPVAHPLELGLGADILPAGLDDRLQPRLEFAEPLLDPAPSVPRRLSNTIFWKK